MWLRSLTDFINDTDFAPHLVLVAVMLPWLAIIPLFVLVPPSEPEGNNRCTHWQERLEETQGRVSLAGPDQETDEEGPAAEQE